MFLDDPNDIIPEETLDILSKNPKLRKHRFSPLVSEYLAIQKDLDLIKKMEVSRQRDNIIQTLESYLNNDEDINLLKTHLVELTQKVQFTEDILLKFEDTLGTCRDTWSHEFFKELKDSMNQENSRMDILETFYSISFWELHMLWFRKSG